jgi:hydroxylaminobenzene mutase
MVWHGTALFLAGLFLGIAPGAMANPRMALSAHVGTLLNGTFLIALGAVWRQLRLPPLQAVAAFWLLVVGSWGSALGLLLAATLGTRSATPIHGAAELAAPWREALVTATLGLPALAVLAGTVLVLRGFGRTDRAGSA